MDLYWGDIHNHTEVGYGCGTLDRAYTIASLSLDFYAFTPHGWWPDLPSSDQTVRDKHERGFRLVADEWGRIIEAANSWYRPGEFVTFIAHEWHSAAWGDFCLYFPGSDGYLCYASSPEELRACAREARALLLPHHCAYPRGLRGTDWSVVDTELSPTAEVFSEHGNSLEPYSHFGMYRHSVGGSQHCQTVIEQIRSGHTLGFTAGTDNHFGSPASYGEGLTAVYAENLSREALFEAIRSRHCYAVTGDRIAVCFRSQSGGIMGDILPPASRRSFEIEVSGHDELDYVEIYRNGTSVAMLNASVDYDPSDLFTRSAPVRVYLRIELGWGGMTETSVTNWDLQISVSEGRVESVTPYFSYGPQTFETVSQATLAKAEGVRIETASTRTNLLATQAAVIGIDLTSSTSVYYDITATWGGKRHCVQGSRSARELAIDDSYVEISESFSAPKMKLHKLVPAAIASFYCKWEDRDADPQIAKQRSSYFAKIAQKNGHLAWTSPIYISANEEVNQPSYQRQP